MSVAQQSGSGWNRNVCSHPCEVSQHGGGGVVALLERGTRWPPPPHWSCDLCFLLADSALGALTQLLLLLGRQLERLACIVAEAQLNVLHMVSQIRF